MSDISRSPAPANKPTETSGGVRTATPVKNKDFTEVAIERGYCTKTQIASALDQHRAENSTDDLTVFLVKKGILTQQQCRACERGMRGATVIAGFEILEKVGQGGMGAVFRARQISMDRVVALKILPPNLAKDPSFKKRFLHEARLSAKLSHLNIINGIDCGEESGYTFFAMEFVDGRTIKDILKERGKLPVGEAHTIIRQMGEALIYAHRQGLVHRDIKPDNIMLTSAGVAKLCDLGLAKHIEKEEDAGLTQAGQAVGTPHYISPEQARGDKSVDWRSDMYSLGATFYHMLCGKTPFEGSTGAAVMALHITEETKSPCDINPEIPEGYGQIVAKMMAKDPADRYLTPEEFVADLDALKNKKPLLAAKFKAKTSCRMPKFGHKGQTTGSHSPIGERRMPTGKQQPTSGSRIPVALGVVLGIAIAGGAGLYVLKRITDASDNVEKIAKNNNPFNTQIPDNTAKIPVVPPVNPGLSKSPDQSVNPKVPDEHKLTPSVPDTKNPGTASPDHKIQAEIKNTKDVKNPPDSTSAQTAKVAKVPATSETIPAFVVTPISNEKPEIPKLVVTCDMIYARILQERSNSATDELTKVQAKLRDISLKPDYEPAKAEINAEIADLNAALNYERAALKAMADAGGEVKLNEATAKKWQAEKGKIVGFNPQRGLDVTVKDGPGLCITARELPMEEIFKFAPDKSVLGKVNYLAARGMFRDILLSLEELQGADKARWEHKVKLSIKGESGLMAQAAFDRLAKVAESKDWTSFRKLLTEFEALYGKSTVAEENVVNLIQWKAASKEEMDGYEASGSFAPEKWPMLNPCTVKVMHDKESDSTYLLVEGEAGAGKTGNGDKSAFSCTEKKNLNLEGKTRLTMRVRHDQKSPLKISLAFFNPESGLFESQAASIPPDGWSQVTFRLDLPVFKSAKTLFLTFDQELAGKDSIKNFGFLVYTAEAYKLEVDRVFFK